MIDDKRRNQGSTCRIGAGRNPAPTFFWWMPTTTELPPELIAQRPVEPRDASRLLVLDRKRPTLVHRTFTDILDYLTPDDVLVLNDTRVFPARLIGAEGDRRKSGNVAAPPAVGQ